MCTVPNSVGMCVCELTACVWTVQCVPPCVCGVRTSGISHGQAGVLKSTNLCCTSLKNIRCDHVLSVERYNSHGKADIVLDLTITFNCCRTAITFGAFISALSVYRPMQTKYSLFVLYLARAWPGTRYVMSCSLTCELAHKWALPGLGPKPYYSLVPKP